MFTKLKKTIPILLIGINLLEIILYAFNRDIVNEDMCRYIQYTPYNKPGIFALNYLELFYKPWRSIFNHRVASRGITRLFKVFIKRPIDSIELFGPIGGGCLILHKQGCVVLANKVGKNLTVAQGVTIGKGHKNSEGRDTPNIGDNVWICPNSVIFGGIDLGNNITVGAGTVLYKSVPNNCTVVGNPARIVKMNGDNCSILL